MSFETDMIQMQLERIWPGWRVSPNKLGHGSYGDVYEIYRDSPEKTDHRIGLVSALKVLRIETEQQDDLTAFPPTMNMFQNRGHSNLRETADDGQGRSATRPLMQENLTSDFYHKPELEVPFMS